MTVKVISLSSYCCFRLCYFCLVVFFPALTLPQPYRKCRRNAAVGLFTFVRKPRKIVRKRLFFRSFRKMRGVNARLQNLCAGRCRRKFPLRYGQISDALKQLKDGKCRSCDGECAGKNFGTNGTLRQHCIIIYLFGLFLSGREHRFV